MTTGSELSSNGAQVFIDVATIHVEAGKGGDGCVSTRREKFVPRGGPDGGNGGRGGSVYCVGTSESSTLLDFRYRSRYKAPVGQPGGGQKKSGAAGEDLLIPVPCGTAVYDAASETLIGDLVETEQRLLIASGGKGGKGNWEFRNPRNQTPMKATAGKPGVSREIRLELKLIADVGLVGEPNAGKSTLLASVTAARPKVADYPFTTLVPNLGIVDLGDYLSCTLADIPGLIEGASAGKGLGHEFLRHIERTRALLLLVDPEQAPPAVALAMLRRELDQYGHRLAELEYAIVLTKSDLRSDEATAAALDEAQAWARRNGDPAVIDISAVTHRGLSELKNLVRHLYLESAPERDSHAE